jgi:Na+-transporting methylmalonyl-CoA/oxaloacetate decarboxylase gamma subunit
MTDLAWGLQMTFLGMGLVFGMLALLWGLLALAGWLDRSTAGGGADGAAGVADTNGAMAVGPAASTAGDGAVPGLGGEPADVSPALRAAIALAVMAHAAQQRGEAAPQVRVHWPGSLLHASRWVAAGRTRQNHAWRRVR